MKHLIYILSAFALLSACSDDVDRFSQVSEEQKSLLGRAVNFDASVADAFSSRATYNATGAFNEGDVMTIYRQYSDDGANFDETHENYRVYYYKPTYAGNTGIILKTEWAIMTGQFGSDGTAADVVAKGRDLFTQQESDTLTWEDGRTVKFRAWALSNLSGAYGNRGSFYPDFTISDWVHASGPTLSIPLSLRHMGFRIGFTPYPGNQITRVEICLNKEDYQRHDNAGSTTDDENDIMSEADAQAIAEKVNAVYCRMCMPGGVDIEKQHLRAMTNEYWNSGDFEHIVSAENQSKMISFKTETPGKIASDAKRPQFIGNNSNFYCISIPYDMSNDQRTSGDVLTLPRETRFRVYLRDVNSGDGMTTSGEEGTYHIFSLSDVLSASDYPEGIKLYAGYSYMFKVGYLYNEFKVDPVHSFSWVEQDMGQGSFADDIPSITPSKTPYKWWQDAIDDAITTAIGGGNFNPNFTISSEAQFLEFINLVNGTAATNAGSLARVWRNESNSENRTNYWWYDPTNVYTAEPPIDDNGDGYLDTLWVKQADAATRGFIFYKHYYPADGDRAAYYTVDYLQGAYNFYSNIVRRAFTVTLTADLDFKDIQLPAPVGNSSTNYFGGIFNGGMHTISNVNLTDGYLFEYTNGASVTNFTLMGKHRLAVVKQGKNTNIAGIASYVPAPATGHALADKLISTSYVVGCIHYTESVYDTPGALVGDADNLYMYGCMQTSRGIEGGALVGRYYSNLAPQDPNDLKWGRFMCNYYDTTLSPSAHAVGNINDNYAPQEYIRGRRTHILCAYSDHLVDKGVYEQLNGQQKLEFYGLAPWKAMNYGIHQYNTTSVGKAAPCTAHYSSIIDGYSHLYPLLSPGVPTTDQYADVLKQGN